MSEIGDRRTIRRIAGGDSDALAELYHRHAPLLATRLRRAGASPAETEDLLQEVFLDVWRAAASFRGEGAVAAWLWGVGRRKLAMLARSESRGRAREQAAATASDGGHHEGAWVTAIDAGRAIGLLDPDLRDAFEAVAVEGLSVRDAAQRLGVPEGTVKSRVHRARTLLREEMR